MDSRSKCKTVKSLEENTRENHCDMGLGEKLDMTLKVWFIKPNWFLIKKLINCTSSKLKTFALQNILLKWKDKVQRMIEDICKSYNQYSNHTHNIKRNLKTQVQKQKMQLKMGKTLDHTVYQKRNMVANMHM